MLSREFESEWVTHFGLQQNRFSVLLALLRKHLGLEEYHILLRIHCSSRQLFRNPGRLGEFQRAWVQELKSELDGVFAGLEVGEFSWSRLHRLVHLYRDLFFMAGAGIQDKETRSQEPGVRRARIQKPEVVGEFEGSKV